ncbi:HPr family phosphocarrier protein [Halobacteriales archaeon QS_1_67_19]|nr:MAG: HPr family phosphocarrier protein [Halobacteriales archaeon QS_1_67_19]
MTERVVTVVPEAGLHARPAAKFVETVNDHDADVEIAPVDATDDPVAADSMIAVTSLGVESDDDVRIVAEGEDADAVLDALEAVLTTPEDELADA